MTPQQHGSFTQTGKPADLDSGLIWTAIVLLLAVGATLGLRAIVSNDALAPFMATVLFGLAATLAGIGLLLRRYGLRASMSDIAGIVTFIGVGVSIAIEPDQMVRLMTWPDRTE